MLTFSNPRLHAEFSDWPLGGNKRGTCVFHVEHHPKRGYRFTRTTSGKPKTATYGGKAAIVDGSDGRTYLIQFAGVYDFIGVHRSDFLSANGALATEKDPYKHSAFLGDESYTTLQHLIECANACNEDTAPGKID